MPEVQELVLNHWTWWVIAAILIILEIFAPGAVFLWLGVAAIVSGFVSLIFPTMSIALQLTFYAVLSVVSVLAGRAYMKKRPIKTEDSGLNRRGEQYVGRLFTLPEPVVNGTGKLIIDDTMWKVSGEDMPAGGKVRVTGVDGVVLTIVAVTDSASTQPEPAGPSN